MADLHVYHTGSNTSPYDTWAKAAPNLSVATAAAAAGDNIYVASDHTESAAGQTLAFTNATVASPIKVVCGVKDTTSGITALATTARVTTTTTSMNMSGTGAYIYGIEFECSGAVTAVPRLSSTGSSVVVYDQCKFINTSSNNGSAWYTGANSSVGNNARTTFINPQFKFNQVGQQFVIGGYVEILGGSFISGTVSPTTFFNIGGDGRGAYLDSKGFDFSLLGTSFDLCTNAMSAFARIRNCKMPSGWTGDLWNSVPTTGGSRTELLNYGTGDTNYKFWTHDSAGYCKEETTVKRTAGASDEAQGYSIRMTSTANCVYPAYILRSPPIIQRVGVGSKTVTVHIAHDGASALTDKECWLEVEYLGNSGFPLAAFANDMAIFTATASAQASSGVGWDGDTGTGPNGSSTWNQLQLDVQALSVAEVGFVIARVCLAKASYTVYADPRLEIQ